MKAIIIGKGLQEVMAFTDSTIGRDAMPLFIPEGDGWMSTTGLAFRIGRLGKNIKEKFALRYVDGIAPIVYMHRRDLQGNPSNSILDNSLVPGHFIPWEGEDIRLDYNERIFIEYTNKELTEGISKSIAEITSISTIKTGDLIIPKSMQRIQEPLLPDQRITVALNQQSVLNLKIK